jgi:hypothetical protein
MQDPSEQIPPSLGFSTFGGYKNIFDSSTFWGAVSTAVVAISPAVNDMISEFLRTGNISPISLLNTTILIATTGITIMGRITADRRVYTPVGFPGRDPSEATDYKSIFDSTTFWGAVSTAAVAILPTINDLVKELLSTGIIPPLSILRIAILLVTTGVTLMGRITASTHVYTPAGLPGPNQPGT